MKKRYVLGVILAALLISTTVMAYAKRPPDLPKPPKDEKEPEKARFSIAFVSGDITTDTPLETTAKTENWDPETVKGKNSKRWEIDGYSVYGSFIIEPVPYDPSAPDPSEGLNEYDTGSTPLTFFDTSKPITIAWLVHRFSKDENEWHVALNQTDGDGIENYHLEIFGGSGVYDSKTDEWTVTFENDRSYVQWWEWVDDVGGRFHNVWKGYLTFTINIQRRARS